MLLENLYAGVERMSKDKIRVGAVQMNCVTKDKGKNLSKAVNFLDRLKGKVDIACFPELFTTDYDLELLGDELPKLAEPIPGKTTELLNNKAREAGLALLGTMVERAGDNLYDTAFIINRDGELIGKYRKSHLYPKEHRYFKAGRELPVFEFDGIKVGVAICFEHAFPHIFTTLALKGAQLIFIPSAIPVGYEYLLYLRTRARAQDNQLFVVAVNLVGGEKVDSYCGRSLIVNPRGEVIAEASTRKEEVLTAEIDLDFINKEREQEPVLHNFRPELYTFKKE
jgi:predicted amidohydrolase